MEIICNSCKETKHCSKFSKKNTKLGYRLICKTCHNKYVREVWYIANATRQIDATTRYKKRNKAKVVISSYSLNNSEEEVNYYLNIEHCEICNSTENLCIDHCHLTLKVRGRLCVNCNSLLGRLGDSAIEVEKKCNKLLHYLNKFETGSTPGPCN